MTEFEDPKAMFEELMRSHRAEKRESMTWEQFSSACAAVLGTEAGQRMIHGLKVMVGFDQPRFWEGDGYSTHAAAKRDGACETVQRIEAASKWSHEAKS